MHDARVFAICDVQKGYSTGKFKLFYKGLLPGHEGVPQLLLADPAYPLFPYIMREFNLCTTNEQVVFDNMLRSARNQVERAFGRLKARWRILLQSIDVNTENVPNIMLSCFVLHNYCEKRHVSVNQTSSKNIVIAERRFVNKIDKLNSYATTVGNKVRETITNYFKKCL